MYVKVCTQSMFEILGLISFLMDVSCATPHSPPFIPASFFLLARFSSPRLPSECYSQLLLLDVHAAIANSC